MKDVVLETIFKHQMIEKGDRIVIGLSGGPDSVFLFEMLRQLKDQLEISLYIAHINHGVRGKEARSDQDFVEEMSKKYNIPFYLKEADMNGYAKKHNLSQEEAGREIRYAFFNEILQELGGGKIAVGHNKNDQAETLLMRFFRGTGLDGLKGIEHRVNNIIRPILDISRDEIEAYLKEENIASKIDKTNLETIYNRNKIRLETIPHIEKNYNPNIVETLFRSSSNFKEDGDFLSSYSKDVFLKLSRKEASKISLNRQELDKEHNSIKSRIIRQAIEEIKGDLNGLSQKHIEDSLSFIEKGQTGRGIDLIDGIRLVLNYDLVEISRDSGLKKDKYSYELEEGLTVIESLNMEIKLEIIDRDNFEENIKYPYIKYFDYDNINGSLQIRNRRNGDIFKPLGMNGKSKKIKDFFIDEKVPRENRDLVPIIAIGEDILWLVGYRVSEDYKVTEKTKRILKIEVLRRI